ncbi:tRNA pseudouridine synthase A [Thauera sp. 27]|uniref:tRNA pseudouridine(38-40) synthase TruA n=1 Tax=Thauera sp. 27 TaxID=305700 RepID=UPI0002D06D0E|nr:tRNA pseudouridine(38-40) synthase TruA [Thauera sp. 27]ENO82978.1 tRNA pseudouridine synthase A [Thauera sp. 27]
MKRIALGVEYAGDAFCGWQSQAHGRTVQDVLESALGQIAAQRVRLHCAGRTDTGVHASVQVAHFDTDAHRPASAWVRGVNALLPAAVVVRWAVEVDDTFHARFLATDRRYRYILNNTPTRPALLAGRVGWFHLPLDEARMAAAAECLVGVHDFSAFRAAGCQAKTPVRLMHEAAVSRQGDYLLFDFRANGFLHHMIRNLVGALVYVGKGRYPVPWMRELLESCDRRGAAPTFAPDGLYLCGVSYPSRWPLPDDGRIIALPQLPLA